MIPGIRLDYQELRTISPKAARQAILQILQSCDGNVTETARILGITRATIYKARKKAKEENLNDTSRAPKRVANKTPPDVEEKVVAIKRATNYGPVRIQEELMAQHGITLSHHTIRNIVRRNRGKIKSKQTTNHRRSPRQFVDWYQATPFQIVQVDVKYIVDHKALSPEQITHIYAHRLPLYQWGALDVSSRFKLIAFSSERTWTNGLTWFLWVTSWLRSHGVTREIVYTVDHGTEFGGDCWWKMTELRHLLRGFGCSLIQNQKRHPEQNAHLERSHRTDDEEFYMPRILSIADSQQFYHEAMNYLYYYNNVRKHSSLARKTPFSIVQERLPTIDARIRVVPPILLDRMAVELGPWSGYHVLAQYQRTYGCRRLLAYYGSIRGTDVPPSRTTPQYFIKLITYYAQDGGFIKYGTSIGGPHQKGDVLFILSHGEDIARETLVVAKEDELVIKLSPTHIVWPGDEVIQTIPLGNIRRIP